MMRGPPSSWLSFLQPLLPEFWLLLLLLQPVLSETFILGYYTGSQRRSDDKIYFRSGSSISGAITLAVEEVNEEWARRGIPHRINFTVAETMGIEDVSIHETARLWRSNVSGYIGPQDTCVHEARMAAAFNLPMISYYCTEEETSDKRVYRTFARTKPSASQIAASVASLLLRFGWDQVALLYWDAENGAMARVANTLREKLRVAGITVLLTKTWADPVHFPYHLSVFDRIVEETREQARVYLILGSQDEHLLLIAALEEQGLLSGGQYQVVGVALQAYAGGDPRKYLRGVLRDRHVDPRVIAPTAEYLTVAPSAPLNFDEFNVKVNQYSTLPPFSYPKFPIPRVIPPEAGYLYDAVHLYARALATVLLSGGDARNGSAIIDVIRGETYVSGLGYMTFIDENGDAQGNYSILARRPTESDPNEFELRPVGVFMSPLNQSALPELQLSEELVWVKGSPPLPEPLCGFTGDKCINEHSQRGWLISGVLMFLASAGALVFYKFWRYEQELDSLLWKLDFKDIQVTSHGESSHKLTRATHPLIRTSQVSLSSNPDSDFRFSAIYTTIGVYKGRVFAIKRVLKKSIDITREMKKELKMLKDLRHDNLNSFIGACTEPPNICIVTEYCTRGSLRDLLDNEEVKLDNMFIASLVSDLLTGITFLHDSQIRYHGRLKSSNCLVDSRWVLKIADFGLHEFKRGAEKPLDEATMARELQGLLYRAPELLREDTMVEEDIGSQKGDIYSFSIILYELHSRKGPFGDTGLQPIDIIDRLRSELCPPFRPCLDVLKPNEEFIRDCICECWSENPDLRPDTKTIRTKLRPMRKGMKNNILDNMVTMMEKYTNNLESLVDERTDQLVAEKKKTDELLYEMLPRPVAEQLKRGDRVQAEQFDSVTIYFSDIVGFTELSAQSTPLQIVDFLNDLYTCFDSTVENFDVYKVETIGDAYMVVSGLPLQNGDQHASEIASMSLALVESVRRFRIRHRPDDSLQLRIGIHSGPVCAGVVGLKMPRYCLFGDTVNTASRMESTGSPGRVHCSSSTAALLSRLGGYRMEERGVVLMKGKGAQLTYWLTGEDHRRALKPRSSMRNKKLARCSSLESPKKLRFASADLLELSDSVMEVADCSTGLLEVGVEHIRRASSSCPCIDCLSTNSFPFSTSAPLSSSNAPLSSSNVPFYSKNVPRFTESIPFSANSLASNNLPSNGSVRVFVDPPLDDSSLPLLS